MKMKLYFALLFVLFGSSFAIAYDIQKGDEAKVSSWEWVNVMNQEAIPQQFGNGSSSLSYGGTCGVEIGGTVTVVGTDVNRGVLVRYKAPGNPMGTPCPSGVLFFIAQEKFSRMTGVYNHLRSTMEEEKQCVKKLLEQ